MTVINKYILLISVIIASVVIIFSVLSYTDNSNNTLSHTHTAKKSHKTNKKWASKKSAKGFKRDTSLLRICPNTGVPKTLDPAPFVNKQIIYLIFDSPVKWDSSGKIINSIAANIKMLDLKTMEMTLVKGITFHNGEPLKANSVKFSIERLKKEKSNSPLSSLFDSIRRIDIINDYKIVIHTKNPDYALIQKLAYVSIIPEGYFNRVGAKYFGKHPVGSGLYSFYQWNKDGSIILKRNNNYKLLKKPQIETVIFKFITGKNSKKEQVAALVNRDIDLLLELQGLYTLLVQQNPNTKVIKLLNPPLVYRMKLNPEKKPFSDLKMREAVNLAINRDLIIKIMEKGNGRKIATNSIDIDFGHNPKLKPYPYNPGKAKKLVKEYSNKPITIKIAATEYAKPIVMAISKDLENIGMKPQYDIMTPAEMTKEFINHSKNKSIPWKYDMAIFASKNTLFHAGIIYEEGLCSSGAWSLTKDKNVDKLCNELIKATKESQQIEICHKLEKLSYDNYWYTPIFQIISSYGAAKDLNIKIPLSTYVDLTTAHYKKGTAAANN